MAMAMAMNRNMNVKMKMRKIQIEFCHLCLLECNLMGQLIVHEARTASQLAKERSVSSVVMDNDCLGSS